jgi:hypothetical protein
VWPVSVRTTRLFCTSHIRTVKSSDPETTNFPSGLTVSAVTPAVWPSRTPMSRADCGFQIRIF